MNIITSHQQLLVPNIHRFITISEEHTFLFNLREVAKVKGKLVEECRDFCITVHLLHIVVVRVNYYFLVCLTHNTQEELNESTGTIKDLKPLTAPAELFRGLLQVPDVLCVVFTCLCVSIQTGVNLSLL